MDSRERILLALEHREADRVAIHDGPWQTTVRRWHREGLPEGTEPPEYFGYEIAGLGFDVTFQLPEETVEETDEYTVIRNSNGALRKNWKNQTSTPETIDFIITDRKKWEEHKPRTKMDAQRLKLKENLPAYEKARKEGKFICFSAPMGYDKTQGIVGSVRLLMAMAEDPVWVKDMFDTSARMAVECAEEALGSGLNFDAAFLYDDLGYRNDSLFSPAMYRELLMPAHRKVFEFFRSKGLRCILHTCGCVNKLVPSLIEAGLSCLQPLETKAGMDLVALKKNFGKNLSFMGGIDVRKMKESPAVIEEEIKTKVGFAKKGGGYIYHSDHSVPDNVSFDQYCRVIELVRKYGRY